MTEVEIQDLAQHHFPEMRILIGAIETLPARHQEQLRAPVNQLSQTLVRRLRVTCMLQEAIEEVRLDIKYLEFDLNATRRERDDYRRRLAEIDSP